MTRLRELTESGIQQFTQYVSAVADGSKDPPPFRLLLQEETSRPLDFEIHLDVAPGANFSSKFELAQFLNESLSALPKSAVDHNRGLWSALSLVLFDQICPARSGGTRKPLHVTCYILPSMTDSGYARRYYRHLLAGPYKFFQLHKGQAGALLSFPVHTHPDTIEQIAACQELITNKSFIGALTELYFEPDSSASTGWKPKRGITNRKKPGTLRRLKEVTNQFELTYDLYGLSTSQILQLLPREFERWID